MKTLNLCALQLSSSLSPENGVSPGQKMATCSAEAVHKAGHKKRKYWSVLYCTVVRNEIEF